MESLLPHFHRIRVVRINRSLSDGGRRRRPMNERLALALRVLAAITKPETPDPADIESLKSKGATTTTRPSRVPDHRLRRFLRSSPV